MPETTSTPRANSFSAHYVKLNALLVLLRSASDGRDALEAMATSEGRLRRDESFRTAFFNECSDLLWRTDFTEVLDEAGMLSDLSLTEGIGGRLGGKISALPGRADMLLDVIDSVIAKRDRRWLDAVSGAPLLSWINALLLGGDESTECREEVTRFRSPRHQIASACVVLASRITGTGANPRLLKRLPNLDDWDSPFVQLGRRVERFAVWFVEEAGTGPSQFDFAPIDQTIDDCEAVIAEFRSDKATYGTNLELSSLSLRVSQQIRRLRCLLQLAHAPREDRAAVLAELAESVLFARIDRYNVTKFVREKFDLVAYLTVGHAAKHGDKYVVYDQRKYAKFLAKSAGGGVLVAIFACLKLYLSKAELAPLPQAFVYGMNYAVCFALIFLLGATLATKQPAMTASRLAESLEAKVDADDFPSLVQAIFRSQFISFVGNILGAATFAIFIAFVVQTVTGAAMVDPEKSASLLKSLHPTQSLSLLYAAIAGVMLSLSGFIAGYVDNAVVFHKVADRIAAGTGLFRHLSPERRQALSRRVNDDIGALTGNVALGFMLGSAGAIGILLGIPFDIRHIAFASSHAALGIMYSTTPTLSLLAVALLSVLMIGFMNFMVSFLLTLAVAIESRKVKGVAWRHQLNALKRLILREPVRFFLARPDPKLTRHDDPLP